MFAAGCRRWASRALLLAVLLMLTPIGCLTVLQPAGQAPDADGDADTTVENTPPVADAGESQTATVGDLVILDGTGSGDADGDRLLYMWRQVSGEPEVTMEDSFSSRPRFLVPEMLTETAVLTFRLTVVDGLAVDFDEVSVTMGP
jgi:hypothetical protein